MDLGFGTILKMIWEAFLLLLLNRLHETICSWNIHKGTCKTMLTQITTSALALMAFGAKQLFLREAVPHCKVFSSSPALQPPDSSNFSLPVVTTKMSLNATRYPLEREKSTKLLLVENYWPRLNYLMVIDQLGQFFSHDPIMAGYYSMKLCILFKLSNLQV